MLFIQTKHNMQIVWGNPLDQAIKWYLNNNSTGKKTMKNEMES